MVSFSAYFGYGLIPYTNSFKNAWANYSYSWLISFSSSDFFSFFSYFSIRSLSYCYCLALKVWDSSNLFYSFFSKYLTLSIYRSQNSFIVLSSSPIFLTRVKGSSRIWRVPYWLPTARMLRFDSWNFIDEIPTEPTEYCIAHLCDWSIKSQISMVPFDLPMNKTPARDGLQQPQVW